jgi:hypothetical protein
MLARIHARGRNHSRRAKSQSPLNRKIRGTFARKAGGPEHRKRHMDRGHPVISVARAAVYAGFAETRLEALGAHF